MYKLEIINIKLTTYIYKFRLIEIVTIKNAALKVLAKVKYIVQGRAWAKQIKSTARRGFLFTTETRKATVSTR